MYRIINVADGKEIGMTDNLVPIRKKNNVFVPSPLDAATGIAYRGKPYNLTGTDGVGADTTIALWEADAGALLHEQAAAESDLDAMAVDHELRIMDLELGISEEI